MRVPYQTILVFLLFTSAAAFSQNPEEQRIAKLMEKASALKPGLFGERRHAIKDGNRTFQVFVSSHESLDRNTHPDDWVKRVEVVEERDGLVRKIQTREYLQTEHPRAPPECGKRVQSFDENGDPPMSKEEIGSIIF
jgi:hypothetical protein